MIPNRVNVGGAKNKARRTFVENFYYLNATF